MYPILFYIRLSVCAGRVTQTFRSPFCLKRVFFRMISPCEAPPVNLSRCLPPGPWEFQTKMQDIPIHLPPLPWPMMEIAQQWKPLYLRYHSQRIHKPRSNWKIVLFFWGFNKTSPGTRGLWKYSMMHINPPKNLPLHFFPILWLSVGKWG